MKIKQTQNPTFGVAEQDCIRFACHANGIVPCSDAKFDRAHAKWRRNPDTGRLQMHWHVCHALTARSMS